MTTKRGRKTDTIQFEKRMSEVFEMILYKKLSFTEFYQQAAERFEISQRQAQDLYLLARKRLKERFSQDREEILQEQLGRLYDLLNRARNEGDRRTENEVLKEMTKIYGIQSPKEIDIKSGGEKLEIKINITTD